MITVNYAQLFVTDPGTPSDVVTAVETWLAEHGQVLDAWDLHELNLPRRVQRAWWGNDEVGFVGRDWPGATMVAVVEMPPQLLGQEVQW